MTLLAVCLILAAEVFLYCTLLDEFFVGCGNNLFTFVFDAENGLNENINLIAEKDNERQYYTQSETELTALEPLYLAITFTLLTLSPKKLGS